MEKKTLHWIIAVLVIFNIITLFRINRLEKTVDNQFQQYQSVESRLRDDINRVYPRVDEMLKKQASILDSYDLVFGKLDPDKFTVPVSLTLTPKAYTDTMAVSMQLKDKSFDMQRNGTIFSVTAEAFIFDDFQPKINLKDKGTTKIETIEGYNGIPSKYLLEIFGGFRGESSDSSTYYKYRGDINIDIKASEDNKPVKASIITEVNGKVIGEKSAAPSQTISLPVDERIAIKPGDRLVIYAKVQDIYGLNYKYSILDYDTDNGNSSNIHNRPDIHGALEISDKNGKILLEQKR